MIKPSCKICKKELKHFGALIFSPPNVVSVVNSELVLKYHVCIKCWEEKILLILSEMKHG